MIREAIILSGGLGTRLSSTVPNLPKCMAPVAGKPFINYVLQHLAGQNVTRFILALGYQSAIIQEYILQHFHDWDISFSIETEPLGTGGAILKACNLVKGNHTIVTNGDTLYKAAIQKAIPFLNSSEAECLLFLKPMQNFERYGVVEMDSRQQITSFKEKKFYEKGLINGGLYLLNVPSFLRKDFSEKFSFEKDYLEANASTGKLYGILDDAYFIDIGIPADYERANRELQSL